MTEKPWAELYADYLKSEEWARRRGKVMQRAAHLCEGCRERPAVDVHHLTYDHVTREFLFELVALCGECHDRIHGVAMRPKTATWTPKHAHRPRPNVPAQTPEARARQGRLADLAAQHRARTMAQPLPETPPPTAERVAALAEAHRKGATTKEPTDDEAAA